MIPQVQDGVRLEAGITGSMTDPSRKRDDYQSLTLSRLP